MYMTFFELIFGTFLGQEGHNSYEVKETSGFSAPKVNHAEILKNGRVLFLLLFFCSFVGNEAHYSSVLDDNAHPFFPFTSNSFG